MRGDDLVSTSVLYDVMQESVTRVRSQITQRYLADPGNAERYIKAQQELIAEAEAVPPRNRAAIRKFTERMLALRGAMEPRSAPHIGIPDGAPESPEWSGSLVETLKSLGLDEGLAFGVVG